ncbi:MAG: hypothetical protein WDO19_09930 [Bacteroidota bacterium]
MGVAWWFQRYYIGSFDGKTFIPETEKLNYAEGEGERGDILYAAESFSNMPDKRRVQIAWGGLSRRECHSRI